MPEKNTDFDEKIILRYFQKNASNEELQALEAWLKTDPAHRDTFNAYLNIWVSAALLKPGFKDIQSRKWQELLYKINKDQPVSGQKNSILKIFPLYARVAAMILLFFALGWFLNNIIDIPAEQIQRYTEISTPRGSRTRVVLPDSSQVWLNAGSTLKYSNPFDGKNRLVYLDGEAYFNVSNNDKRMFVVETSDILISVYGTVFNVKSYPEEGTIETTLIEGKIAIARNTGKPKRKQQHVYLEPNQKATYIRKEGRIALTDLIAPASTEEQSVKSGSIIINENVDTEKVASWRSGQLILDQEPLRELAIKLERKYDVHFEFEDEGLKQFRFTGILEDETLEQVLYAMQLTAPITYRIDRKTVYLNALPGYKMNK